MQICIDKTSILFRQRRNQQEALVRSIFQQKAQRAWNLVVNVYHSQYWQS